MRFAIIVTLSLLLNAQAQNIGFGTNNPTHHFHTVGNIRFQSSFLNGSQTYILFTDSIGVLAGIPLNMDSTTYLSGTAQWKTINSNDNWGTQTVITQVPIVGNGLTSSPLAIMNGSVIDDILKWDGTQWIIEPLSASLTTINQMFMCTNMQTRFVLRLINIDTLCNSLLYDNSQSVGIGTSTPSSSAIIDISSSSKGVLIPRITTSQRNSITSPTHGLLIFNTDNSCLEMYDSASMLWLPVSCPTSCSACDSCPVPRWNSIIGPNAICPDIDTFFYVDDIGGNTYTWHAKGDWQTLTIGDTAYFHVGWQSGWVYASACNECGCSTDSIMVSILPYPSQPTISADASTVCSGSTVTLTANPGTNPSYIWEVLNPQNNTWQQIVGANTSSLTLTVPYFPIAAYGGSNTDRFRVRACGSNGCCSKWSSPISISFLTSCRFCYVYGTPGVDNLKSVVELSDGSIVSGGYINNGTESIIMKTKQTGDTIWTLRISIGSTSSINAIVALPNDDVIAVGEVDNSMFISRINPSGNIIWLKQYNHPSGGIVTPYGASLSQNGNYILVTGDYDGNMGVWEIDLNGSIQYSEELRLFCCGSVGYDIIQPAAPNVRLVAVGRATTGSNSVGLLFKIYFNTWQTVSVRVCTTSVVERYSGIVEDPTDKHYIVSGHGSSFNKYVIAKIDSSADASSSLPIYWAKAIDQGGTGDLEMANAITLADNGSNVVIVGQDSVAAGNVSDIFAVKVSGNGNVQWTNFIGNQGTTDAGQDVTASSNGDIIIVGSVRNTGSGDDLFITRISQSGTTNTSCGSGCASGSSGTPSIATLSCDGAKISPRAGAGLLTTTPVYNTTKGLTVQKICP